MGAGCFRPCAILASRHCDWICLARGGRDAARPGPKGDKGDQGAKGDAAPTILEWVLDYDNYRAIPVMSDGSPAPVLELRGLFERFFDETVHGRVIGISARLSDCKRRSDSGAC
jgi:hypothetical protein